MGITWDESFLSIGKGEYGILGELNPILEGEEKDLSLD